MKENNLIYFLGLIMKLHFEGFLHLCNTWDELQMRPMCSEKFAMICDNW